jgi:hypothetical protein
MEACVFDSLTTPEARPLVLLRRAIVALLGVCSVTAACSGYRAYYQVRSLELTIAEAVVREGSVLETTVVTSGRTDVDVKIELVQGAKAVTLAEQYVPGSDWASIDPRARQASQRVRVPADALARMQPGAAVVRATAVGRPQWLRLPPPTVREVAVMLELGHGSTGAAELLMPYRLPAAGSRGVRP